MKVTLTNSSDTSREMLVEVPQESIVKAIEKETKKVRNRIHIPGFRKGKAPLNMVKSQFGPQIESTAVEDVINVHYRKALIEQEIIPLAPADISDLEYEPGKPMTFKATFEVEPEIVVESWKGMKVEKEEVVVTEEMQDETIKRIQLRFAKTIDKDGPSEEGDQVLIEMVEVDAETGVELVGRKLPERPFRIGDKVYGEEFDKQLIGLSKGDEKIATLPIAVGAEEDPALPNKTVESFKITANNVQTMEIPELDDELAIEMKYESVDELREHVKNDIQRQLDDSAAHKLRQELEKEAVRIINPPVPNSMVERYLKNFADKMQQMSGQQQQIDMDKIREEQKEMAQKKVAWFLIREAIIKSEPVGVTDEMIDDFIKKYAEDNKLDYERLRLEYKKNEQKHELKNELMDRKIFEFLENHAKVKVVKSVDK